MAENKKNFFNTDQKRSALPDNIWKRRTFPNKMRKTLSSTQGDLISDNLKVGVVLFVGFL